MCLCQPKKIEEHVVSNFAESCSKKVFIVDEVEFNKIIESTNAKNVLVANADCFKLT